jgi:hypothetical protein
MTTTVASIFALDNVTTVKAKLYCGQGLSYCYTNNNIHVHVLDMIFYMYMYMQQFVGSVVERITALMQLSESVFPPPPSLVKVYVL